MQVDDCLAALGGQQESAVFLVVHEEILHENSRAEGVLEDVEEGLEVGVASFDDNCTKSRLRCMKKPMNMLKSSYSVSCCLCHL